MRRYSLILVLFIASEISAAPNPTSASVSGGVPLANGVTITVSGSGFGTKSPAKPVIWADFEDGSGNPTSMGSKTSWDGSGGISTSTTGCYAGAFCAESTAGWLNSATGSHLDVSLGFGRSTKYYVSLKRYSSQTPYYTASAPQNTKTFRFWKDTNGGTPDWFIGTQVDGTNIIDAESVANQVTNTTRFYINGTLAQPPASWRTEEYLMTSNSSTGTANGTISININNANLGSSTAWEMDDSGTPGVSNFFVLEQVAANNGAGQWCNTGNVWFDNVYVDSGTWARIEICDGSTYATSVNCEMQIPSAWADGSITATANVGTISGHKYLYVFDSTNANNATGLDLGTVDKSTTCPCK